MKWYNIFAKFYDKSLEKLYHHCRVAAIEAMNLTKDSVVLDVACGTGQNFKHIVPFLGEQGYLIGTDFSAGMLKQAEEKIKKYNWKQVYLIEKDAQKFTLSDINEHVNQSPTHILCVLGFSVIPNWEAVLDNMLRLLDDNGTLIIVDVYAEKRTIHTWMVERVARADISRQPWLYLKEKGWNYELKYLPGKPSKYGGRLFLVKVTKGKSAL